MTGTRRSLSFQHFSLKLIVLFLCFFILSTGTKTAAPASTIKAGVAETIITPPVGVPLSGYARTAVSDGVHDDLFARSLAIEGKDGTAVIMMSVGLISLSRDLIDAIRGGISSRTNIPPKQIMISSIHTHSGPSIPESGPEYRKFLIERSVESAVKAWNNRVPGKIGFGSTQVFDLGHNRRTLAYGGLHPDPEVCIIRIEDLKGGLLGVAFNYGCHPSTLDLHNLKISEDWPFFAIREIKKKLGEKAWVAYFQSAEGNINVGYTAEHSAIGAEMPIRSFWYAELKGIQMSEAVLKTLPGIAVSPDPIVRTVSGYTDLPYRDSFPESLKEAGEKVSVASQKLVEAEKSPAAKEKRGLDPFKVELFFANLNLETAKWFYGKDRPASVRVEQQAVLIGTTALVTFPGEIFAEIGLKVKKASPFPRTLIIGLANDGEENYMPTADEYPAGGYEVIGTWYSPRAEQALVDGSVKLLEKMVRQK